MKASRLRLMLNLWPPFLFSGIRVTRISEDFREVDVELRSRFYNCNYVGTHFGGSIFAMTDPFHMLMLMHLLGRDYTVWDRAASITFLKPGTGTLHASFQVDDTMLDEIRRATVGDSAKFTPVYPVEVTKPDGEVVARVEKTVHIRRRADTRPRRGEIPRAPSGADRRLD